MKRCAVLLLVIAGCSKSSDGISAGSGSQRGHSHKREAAGGFSDELANSLGSDGSAGSGGSGSAAPSIDAGSAAVVAVVAPDAPSAVTPTPTPTPAPPAATPDAPVKIATPAPPHVPVKTPAELAAIKLSLLPNWERDVDAPGTIQLEVKGARTFVFTYGYEDASAPSDREAYKKWLAEKTILGPRADGTLLDRQRGSAWYLEGTGPDGAPAFRYEVLYGGKRLVCFGSLYKDAASNPLGDIRDQTIIQAKQICETLAL